MKTYRVRKDYNKLDRLWTIWGEDVDTGLKVGIFHYCTTSDGRLDGVIKHLRLELKAIGYTTDIDQDLAQRRGVN